MICGAPLTMSHSNHWATAPSTWEAARWLASGGDPRRGGGEAEASCQGVSGEAAVRPNTGCAPFCTNPGGVVTVSAARREVNRVALVKRGIRPLDVSRFPGLSTARVADHQAAIRSKEEWRSYEARSVTLYN